MLNKSPKSAVFLRVIAGPSNMAGSFLLSIQKIFFENCLVLFRKNLFITKKNTFLNQIGKCTNFNILLKFFVHITIDYDALCCTHGPPKVTHCLRPLHHLKPLKNTFLKQIAVGFFARSAKKTIRVYPRL